MSRKSKGRKKLDMVKISKESNLLVTFSKRKYGIFKKASELSTLCGAEITIILFSPGKKIFSFGHPSVEAVVQRFLTRKPTQFSGSQKLTEAHRNARICELNAQLTQVEYLLEMERKTGEEIDKARKVREAQNWWESPIQKLNFEQLHNLKTCLEVLSQNVDRQVEYLLIQTTNTNNNNNNNNDYPAILAPNSLPGTRFLPFESKTCDGFNTSIVPYEHHRLGFGNGFF
ncbi:Agamous-like MADS-box protein AGL62 [Euphorbia peplus]|nr:Agamous-like MADS-box protein AGL62 [Euphorbia peplus]